MFFWNKICGIIAIFFILADSSYAQKPNTLHFSENNLVFLKNSSRTELVNFSKKGPYDSSFFSFNKIILPETIPSDFSTCQYGFFCREELKIEKVTRIPIRIRLGTLQQCNYYEGKQ